MSLSARESAARLDMFESGLSTLVATSSTTSNWLEKVLKTPSQTLPDTVCIRTTFPTCEVAACMKWALL